MQYLKYLGCNVKNSFYMRHATAVKKGIKRIVISGETDELDPCMDGILIVLENGEEIWAAFNSKYGSLSDLGFSEALDYLMRGTFMSRKSWELNGNILFVALIKGWNVSIDGISYKNNAPTFICYHSKTQYSAWTPTAEDMLANDWGYFRNSEDFFESKK